jgi:hypothetical protein
MKHGSAPSGRVRTLIAPRQHLMTPPGWAPGAIALAGGRQGNSARGSGPRGISPLHEHTHPACAKLTHARTRAACGSQRQTQLPSSDFRLQAGTSAGTVGRRGRLAPSHNTHMGSDAPLGSLRPRPPLGESGVRPGNPTRTTWERSTEPTANHRWVIGTVVCILGKASGVLTDPARPTGEKGRRIETSSMSPFG